MRLAAEIRRKALRGPAFWCTAAFLVILASSLIMVIATTLYALSWVSTLSVFGWESFEVASNRPDDYVRWISDAARRWSAVRGNALAPPSQWISLAAVTLLLFIVGISGFSRRTGYSLIANDWLEHTPERARRILDEFGYFNDILADDSGGDVMAARRRIVFPSGLVKNLTNDKPPSVEEEVNLRFFMGHEYAHVLTYDNAAHSLFRLVFWFTASLTSVLLLLLVVPTVMVAVPLAGSLLFFLPVCTAIIFGVLFCLVASMGNVIFSYFKAREYFADVAAYAQLPAETDPYRFKKAGPTSAWDRSVSKLERDLHRQSTSLNARNMLPALLVLFVSLRSLFIVVTPAGAEWSVLAFDGIFLTAIIMLARNLPPSVQNPAARPLLPWLIAFWALLALFFSIPGLLGMLVYFHQAPIIAENTGILLAWPMLFATAICGWYSVRFGWARIFKISAEKPQENRVFSRAGRWHTLSAFAATPGRFFSAMILVILLTLGTMSLNSVLEDVIYLRLPSNMMLLGLNLAVAVVLLALACLVYRNLLFLKLWLFITEVLLVVPLLASLAFIMTIVGSAPPSVKAEDGPPDITPLLANAPPETIAAACTAALVLAMVYFIAKLVEYIARRFDRAKRTRGDVYG